MHRELFSRVDVSVCLPSATTLVLFPSRAPYAHTLANVYAPKHQSRLSLSFILPSLPSAHWPSLDRSRTRCTPCTNAPSPTRSLTIASPTPQLARGDNAQTKSSRRSTSAAPEGVGGKTGSYCGGGENRLRKCRREPLSSVSTVRVSASRRIALRAADA